MVTVAFVIFVALVASAQARSAVDVGGVGIPPRRSALVIPPRVAAKICPWVVHYSSDSDLTYIGKLVNARHVRCKLWHEPLQMIVTTHVIRFKACEYQFVTSFSSGVRQRWVEGYIGNWCVR